VACEFSTLAVPLILMRQLVNVFDPSVPAMSTIIILMRWSAFYCSRSWWAFAVRWPPSMPFFFKREIGP